MHSYLRAIGFSKIVTKKDMDVLIGKALYQPTEKITCKTGINTTLVQVNKEYGNNIGLSIVGEYDEKGFLNVEHYFPYLRAGYTSIQEEIQVEKHADREAYSGVCENINVGVSLIFYMQNIVEFTKYTLNKEYENSATDVAFSALSKEAVIILEISKDENQRKNEKVGNESRNNLLAAARAGDIDAIESLTLEDMDMYTIISKRAKNEDILSIVDSYFMPYGIESDQYSILGNIISVNNIFNNFTGEMVYEMQVECNNVMVDICINAVDLLGEPLVGRRFKGIVWLQGKICNFSGIN